MSRLEATNEEILQAKNTYKKFQSEGFRSGQLEAVKFAIESPKKVVVLCAPTGTGKSLIGMVAGKLHNRFAYLCSSKQLQNQITHDFPEAKTMQGRNNFPCPRVPGRNCSDCTHTKATPCELKGAKPCEFTQCDYEDRKCEVLRHPYQILNYHYFLFEGNYVGKFSDYPFILADEADVLDNILTGFIGLGVTERNIQDLDLELPEYKTATAANGLSSWEDWAFDARVKVKKHMETIEAENTSSEYDELNQFRQYNSYKSLLAKLDIFLPSIDETWIFEAKDSRYVQHGSIWNFKPAWLTKELARMFFWRHANKFVLTSATFPPAEIIAKTLGVDPEDIDYAEMGAAFPVANRPVYIEPAANLSYKTFDDEVDKLLVRIEEVVDAHPDVRGTIHTVSWKLNKHVMSLDNLRFITHGNGNGQRSKEEALALYLRTPGAIFVSPSSTRGLDLPGDACRFNIIAKTPFLSLGDKLTKTRTYSSNTGSIWYRSMAAQEIVQACGRGVRNKSDWCESYILDTQAFRLITQNRRLFPDYFIDAVDF